MEKTKVGQAIVEKNKSKPEEVVNNLLEETIHKENIESPEFAVLFISSDFPAQSIASRLSKKLDQYDCDLIGCTTAGEISNEKGPSQSSAVLTVVESDKINIKTEMAEKSFDNPFKCGRKVAASTLDKEYLQSDKDKVLLVLSSATNLAHYSEESTILEGIRTVAGSEILIVGGMAGDDWTFIGSKVIYNDKISKEGVIAMSIETDYAVDVDQRHGLNQVISSGVVSDKKENIIKEINGEPAAEWYADKVGTSLKELKKSYTVDTLWGNLKIFSHYSKLKLLGKDPVRFQKILEESMDYPLGDRLTSGSVRPRVPIAITSNNGIVLSRTPVYQDMQIDVIERQDEDIITGSKDFMSQEEGGENVLSFVFECCFRGNILDREGKREESIEILKEQLDCPLIGYYTYGELGGRNKVSCNFKTITVSGFKLREK